MKYIGNNSLDSYGFEKVCTVGEIALKSRALRERNKKLALTLKVNDITEIYVIRTVNGITRCTVKRYRCLVTTLLIRKRAGLSNKVRGNEKRIRSQKMGNGIVLQSKTVLISKNERRKAAILRHKM